MLKHENYNVTLFGARRLSRSPAGGHRRVGFGVRSDELLRYLHEF